MSAPGPLIIRADAGSAMGAGHVMRCLALAQQWQDLGGSVTLVGRVQSGALEARLAAEGLGRVLLDCDPGTPADLEATLAALDKVREAWDGRPWLVLDGYALGPDYQRAVRRAGNRLMVVDDYGHQPAYEADVLFNQNIGAVDVACNLNPEAVRLEGLRYALLRREFRDAPVSGARPGPATRLLATAGGGDAQGMLARTLRALALTGRTDWSVRLACGFTGAGAAELAELAASLPFEARRARPDEAMPGLMAWADMAVSAAGSTLWELALMGVPCLSFVLQENQLGLATGMAGRGALRYLGWAREVTDESLARELAGLADDAGAREAMRKAAEGLVDGRGARRTADVLLALSAGGDTGLTLREARPGDCRQYWLLASDPTVRAQAFSPEPIAWDDHCAWFRARLDSASTAMWALTAGDAVAAQVRYDFEKGDAAIDYSVHPGFRGRGLGARLLRRTAGQACRRLGAGRAVGVVLEDNVASLRSFARAGFVDAGPTVERGRACRVMALAVEEAEHAG